MHEMEFYCPPRISKWEEWWGRAAPFCLGLYFAYGDMKDSYVMQIRPASAEGASEIFLDSVRNSNAKPNGQHSIISENDCASDAVATVIG